MRFGTGAAEALLELGLNVAVDSVWKPADLRSFRDRLGTRATLRIIRLVCEPSENRRRDRTRCDTAGNDAALGPRVDELRAELDAIVDWPAELRTIDTTGLSLDDVLQRLV